MDAGLQNDRVLRVYISCLSASNMLNINEKVGRRSGGTRPETRKKWERKSGLAVTPLGADTAYFNLVTREVVAHIQTPATSMNDVKSS